MGGTSGHVVLLGDSIFDNALYVPGGPSVIDHLRRALPERWQATLLAIDGAVVSSAFRQLERIPEDVTHLVLSVGGNDALWLAGQVFSQSGGNVRESLQKLASTFAEFQDDYGRLVTELAGRNLPLTICTIYDRVPGLDSSETAGLCLFNDTISRVAFSHDATLIDLRLVCDQASDYSAVSPIEPSATGGAKIVEAITRAIGLADKRHRSVIV